ncbi:methyltransferase [Candidatus Woesearchaeota archaeon]|nr:methyltransferase [Candidatus Woesearchaeota archaeon]
MEFNDVIRDIEIKSHPLVYAPDEDTFMLAKQVFNLAKGRCLEVGAGSGYTCIMLAKMGFDISCVDINPNAIELISENSSLNKVSIPVKYSDLFGSLSCEKFDTIIFNPPYLPASMLDQNDPFVKSVDGGKKGYEITKKFIDSLNPHLTVDGQAIIIFSSLTKLEKIIEFIVDNCLDYEMIEERNVGLMEKLYVLKIIKSFVLKTLEEKGLTNIKYLAKGRRGVIYVGDLNNEKIAIKIHNPKSQANTINFEYDMLLELNKLGIGPKVIFNGHNFFAYHFIDGINIDDKWIELSAVERKKVLFEILDKLRILDSHGYNKDEMKYPYKHILIDSNLNVNFIDFERCKRDFKAHNITQFTNYIVGSLYPLIDKEILFGLAREYSKEMNDINFKKIIDFLKENV